jgi:isopentenyl-diphosphate delta-isomerase type 1
MTVMDELFDIVSEVDVVIGQASRKMCHGNPDLIHRAVHVLVFNPGGELLLQQRSLHKDIQPGKWDTSVGGHLEVGESYITAAHREMAEELGLTGLPLTFLYNSKIRNLVESENISTYLTVTARDIIHDTSEISAVRFWSHTEIDIALGEDVFTPNFEEEWRMLQAFTCRYLADGPTDPRLCSGATFPDLWQQFSQILPSST